MPTISKVFRGDDDSLVDALVAACAEHKADTKEKLPGFGRELQPYFAEGEEVPLPNACKTTAKPSKSPQRLAARGPFKAENSKGPKPTSPPARRSRPVTATAPIAINQKVSMSSVGNCRPQASLGSSPPACPGIFSSPLPSELPRPSFELIKSANSPTSSRLTSGHLVASSAYAAFCGVGMFPVHTSIPVKA